MNEHYPFVNPPLPYRYNALEPCIDTKTMHLHHDYHLQTYVNNLNHALKNCPALHGWSLEQLLCNANRIPVAIRKSVVNNAGGVYNHIFYFNEMCPFRARQHYGQLGRAMIRDFGSVERFIRAFKEQALSVFGSGYAWLVANQKGKLLIVTTANQDTPLTQNLCPILAIDVWEHAYYLKHYSDRAAYIDDWFKTLDWSRAEEVYTYCLQKPGRIKLRARVR